MPNPNGHLRPALFMLFGIFFIGSANSAIIEIIEQANGSFEIFSDGARYGGAATRAAAEKVAQKLSVGGNTINWTKASVNPTGATASAATGATTGPKASINSNGTFRSEPFTRAGTQYVREELVGGQIRYKNVATGKYVSASEALGTNVPATTPKPGSNLPATTTKPGTNLPATTTKPGTNLPATTTKPGTNLPATTNGGGGTKPPAPNPKPASNPAPSTPKVNVGGVAMGALGMVTGAIGLYESVEAKDTKTTWSDVGTGAVSGLTFAAGTASVVNAIPVGGQIAYGAAMAVGTVVGAAGAGAKMFSETDCDMDPVTGQYACCNVSKLTNIQARLVNIGDEMFGEFPYVRTCMQGKNKFESDWITARFRDDHWSETGEIKFCSGWEMPGQGDFNIQAYGSSEAAGKVCWQWECADPGFTRRGNTCVADDTIYDGGTLDEVVVVATAIRAGDPCPADRLPQYATAGQYIKNGKNPDTGLDKFVCAATECRDGTYLVKNDAGVSQGWCRAGTAPTVATTAKPDATKPTEATVVKPAATNPATATVVKPEATNTITGDNQTPPQDQIGNNVPQTPCERGERGYVSYNGRCITDAEHKDILAQRQAQEMTAARNKIKKSANTLKSMSETFKVSVWKNKEGKFNTARLASDSIAGVVLGTAGGLITSSVVKKNQVKNGFEDIQCVIGGQVVADWGDEFRVGIQ